MATLLSSLRSRALAWLVLAACLGLSACINEVQINPVEAMPPGATETALPSGIAEQIMPKSAAPAWIKGITGAGDYATVCAHLDKVCTSHGYKKAQVAE